MKRYREFDIEII